MNPLVLHIEAATHTALVAEAAKTLGVHFTTLPVAAPQPAAPIADVPPPPAPVAAAPVAPAPAAALPAPAPRATRKRTPAAPIPPEQVVTSPAPVLSTAAAAPTAPQGPANSAPAAASSTEAKVPTVDEVRYALSEVNGAFGMAACTDMLKAIGVDRVSMVPDAKRAEFIATCQKKVADHKAANKPAAGA